MVRYRAAAPTCLRVTKVPADWPPQSVTNGPTLVDAATISPHRTTPAEVVSPAEKPRYTSYGESIYCRLG